MVKKDFNYQIPIAEVEKAGISTTGAVIDNELVPLASEFKEYCQANELWQAHPQQIQYEINGDEIHRVVTNHGKLYAKEVFYK